LCKIFNILRISPPLLPKKEEPITIKYFPFPTEDSLKEWEEKVFNKKVDYRIESKDNEFYVHAASNRSCSALYHKVKLDVNRQLMLSWKWRINSFPAKKSPDNLLSKEEDDYAARIYVIFPALFFLNSKALEYIWSKDLKVGTISSSPYSDNIKIIVAESGAKEGNEWVIEERNIYDDYKLAFNTPPKFKIGAIAFMCDSDSTRSSADACFGEIKIFINR
jgi:hypothetical protein